MFNRIRKKREKTLCATIFIIQKKERQKERNKESILNWVFFSCSLTKNNIRTSIGMLMECAHDSLVPSPLRETWSRPSNMHNQPYSPPNQPSQKLKHKQTKKKEIANELSLDAMQRCHPPRLPSKSKRRWMQGRVCRWVNQTTKHHRVQFAGTPGQSLSLQRGLYQGAWEQDQRRLQCQAGRYYAPRKAC